MDKLTAILSADANGYSDVATGQTLMNCHERLLSGLKEILITILVFYLNRAKMN